MRNNEEEDGKNVLDLTKIMSRCFAKRIRIASAVFFFQKFLATIVCVKFVPLTCQAPFVCIVVALSLLLSVSLYIVFP